jgi:hypothetical protein
MHSSALLKRTSVRDLSKPRGMRVGVAELLALGLAWAASALLAFAELWMRLARHLGRIRRRH